MNAFWQGFKDGYRQGWKSQWLTVTAFVVGAVGAIVILD